MTTQISVFGLHNFLDLYPIDYYVWDAVENYTNHCTSITRDQLIDRIKVVFEGLQRETVKSACFRFLAQTEATTHLNGGYFE